MDRIKDEFEEFFVDELVPLDFGEGERRISRRDTQTNRVEKKFNIGALKQMFTSVFPNLQRPNIQKI
jgi:hypothetical protein